jgi:hypothetical protein
VEEEEEQEEEEGKEQEEKEEKEEEEEVVEVVELLLMVVVVVVTEVVAAAADDEPLEEGLLLARTGREKTRLKSDPVPEGYPILRRDSVLARYDPVSPPPSLFITRSRFSSRSLWPLLY